MASDQGPPLSAPPMSPLPNDINVATRSLHTQLNRLITSRLPLCLPPHTGSSTLYAAGLEHFAHIFLTFESLFHDLASQSSVSNPALSVLLEDPWVHVIPSTNTTSPPGTPPVPPTEHDVEVQNFLAILLPAGLPRSRRLLNDLALLRKQHRADLSASLASFPGQTIQEICAHIREVGTRKPHVLIAYAWCFYMAVFSGGRWIRGQLASAGPEFWGGPQAVNSKNETSPEPAESPRLPTDLPGLSFWHFSSSSADGESIKTLFKSNLSAADNILTASEREDVLAEAQNIFAFCADLVAELDEACSTPDNLTHLAKPESLAAAILPSPPATPSAVAEAYAARQTPLSSATLRLSPRKRELVQWSDLPNLAAAAVVMGCVSWVAIQQLECFAVTRAWLGGF